MTDIPGREIPKEYREIAVELVNNQGWRYAIGKKHPVLYPADTTRPAIRVATTPTTDPRALKNWVAQIRRSGGIWPAPRRG